MQESSSPITLKRTLDNIQRSVSYLTDALHNANAQKIGEDQLVSEKVVAKMLGVSLSLLQHQRLSGEGVPFVRIGRSVRYSLEKVRAHIEANTRRSTSDCGQ